MSKCQGDIPITTKVDESTRDFIDKLAGDADVSRAEILRQLLERYHESEEGNLECPSCAQGVRIGADNIEVDPNKPDKMLATRGKNAESRQNASAEDSNTTAAISPDLQTQINELDSIIENQQQELKSLQKILARQDREITDLYEPNVSPQRIEYLEEQVEWQGAELQKMVPRIEALTEVSNLTDHGICPNCSGELTVEQSLIDIGDSPAIECTNCELVVGHRA